MNNHVTDLEWSKTLKEKGFPQETIHYRHENGGLLLKSQVDWIAVKHGIYKVYAAPLTDELLRELPNGIFIRKLAPEPAPLFRFGLSMVRR